jgi:hypothetical protein
MTALPHLVRHIARMLPWATLLAGCLTSIALFTVLARVAVVEHDTTVLDQGTVRLCLLPAVAALAFVVRAQFRPLTLVTPVPAWVTSAGQLLLTVPVLVLTCWVQLRILALATGSHPPPADPTYALAVQLLGWATLPVAAAACVARSRYADLGGAIAAPITFVLIAVASYTPGIGKFLVRPDAMLHSVVTGWSAIAAAALTVTCLAMRDSWHRYTRIRSRQRQPRPDRVRGGTQPQDAPVGS